MIISCVYVLSCVGRGICDGLITRPGESYSVFNCMWVRNLNTEEDKDQIWVTVAQEKKISSVSIVSGYGWTTGRSRFDPRQTRKKFFCSLCVQAGSGAHPASCTMGTGGPFPGVKSGRGVTLTISCRGLEWAGAIPPLPKARSWRVCHSFSSKNFAPLQRSNDFRCYRK
jgi:hypothetical protein